MTPETKLQFIQRIANDHIPALNEKILGSIHAVKKLRIEGLRKSQVEISLRKCIIIEDYHHTPGRPLPDCLVLELVDSDPIHSVVAIDADFDRILIITVYRPSAERWDYGWEKRTK